MPESVIDSCFEPGGCWSQPLVPIVETQNRSALFLDRDGVVVEEVNYLHRPQDVRLVDGVVEVIGRANDNGIPVILTTNQAGIGRLYYAWEHFAAVQDKLIGDLAAAGVRIAGVFACPYHIDARPPYQHPDHPARKPNPGMMLMARDTMGIALAGSWIVGDRAIDVRAGRNAGIAGATHVRTGHGARVNERETALALATPTYVVHAADSIADLLVDTAPFEGRLSAS